MLKLKSVNFEHQQFQIYQLEQSYAGQVEWVIGRNPKCDLVLSSPEVSRIHGRIVYADETYHFVDIGSTSGSLLNGEAIPANDQRSLRPGDLLQLGEVFLYVQELSPPNAAVSALSYNTPLLPERQWAGEDLVCRCCRIVDETPDVKTFSFIAEPPVLFHYHPGQFVNLKVEIDGKSVMRCYSISSSPTRPYHLSLTVKRVPGQLQEDTPPGLVSNWLHDHLQVGDCVELVGGALGQFTCLPEVPAKMLLISAGSGITPMMSMSRWVQDTLIDTDIIFLHSARTWQDVIFKDELKAMAAQMPNFHLAVTLTRSPLEGAWMGLTGRISKSLLNVVVPDLMERSVYACGSEPFMQEVRSILDAVNFPMQHYQEESFGGGKPAPVSVPASASASVSVPVAPPVLSAETDLPTTANRHSASPASASCTTVAPMVSFMKSERDVMADGSTSILELAEQEGVEIRHACRVGACGACKVMLRQGQVRYDVTPAALTAADQEAGYALACVAVPTERLMVEA